MAKTSYPQAPRSSSWAFCFSSGTVPSTREHWWTAKAYLTLSLQSPGSYIAAEGASSSIGASHHSERPLRQSARFSLQGSRDGPRVWQGRPVYDDPQSCCFVAISDMHPVGMNPAVNTLQDPIQRNTVTLTHAFPVLTDAASFPCSEILTHVETSQPQTEVMRSL